MKIEWLLCPLKCIFQGVVLFTLTICSLSLNAAYIAVAGSGGFADSAEIMRLTVATRDFFRASEFDKARQAVDSIYLIAKIMNWEKKIGDCHFNYGLIERRRNNFDGFFYNTTLAAEIYLREQAWHEAARTYTSLAQAHVALENYPSAYEAFYKSLDLRELTGDSSGITNNLINIGNLYYLEGKMADASASFYRALRYADLLENKNLAAIALMNMGNVLIRQANYDKAIEYLELALTYHQDGKNRKEEANVLHNLGIVHFETSDYEQAKKYYLQALVIQEELNAEMPELVKIYNNLGVIAKEEGAFEMASEYYLRTLELARAADDRSTEAAVLTNLGSIKLNQKDPDGLPFFTESLEIARHLGLRKLVLANYNNLVQHYTAFSNFEKALDYAIKHQALNDSIYNEETAAKIIELQTRYDTGMKEKENLLLISENLMRKQTQRFFMIASIVLVVLSVPLLRAFMLKRKTLLQSRVLFARESELTKLKIDSIENQNHHLSELLFAEEEIKSLQKQRLQQKSQELTSATMLIASKNEVFTKLKKLAEGVKDDASDKNKQWISEIIGEIDRQTDFENQWDQFKTHFESIHKLFFTGLLRCNPSLTQTDLQLCAYIKLNMSTKEICRLMNIAYKSVNMQRYRLRKKFGLEEGQTLDEFIHMLT